MGYNGMQPLSIQRSYLKIWDINGDWCKTNEVMSMGICWGYNGDFWRLNLNLLSQWFLTCPMGYPEGIGKLLWIVFICLGPLNEIWLVQTGRCWWFYHFHECFHPWFSLCTRGFLRSGFSLLPEFHGLSDYPNPDFMTGGSSLYANPPSKLSKTHRRVTGCQVAVGGKMISQAAQSDGLPKPTSEARPKKGPRKWYGEGRNSMVF